MRAVTRRRLDAGLLTGGAVAAGVVGAIGAHVGNTEEIDRMWVAASLGQDGAAQITEVIDYDFGNTPERHGIFRDVPDLPLEATVEVVSPTAPDRTQVEPAPFGGGRIRIGDPNTTISGRHQYRIDYPLAGVAPGGRLNWNAVGDRWEVDLSDVEVHVVAPWTMTGVACNQGTAGTVGGCEARQVEPGHLVVTADRLSAGEGITIEAAAGEPLGESPSPPSPPSGLVAEDGTGIAQPAGTAGLAALLTAVPVSMLVRRAGREETWADAGGAADVAFGTAPAGTSATHEQAGAAPARRIDTEDLHDLATTEFAPPEGVSPAQGGILLTETVEDEHKVAWLLEQAHAGSVRLEGEGEKPVLVRGEGELDPVLKRAFGKRTEVQLGEYDSSFGAAWDKLGKRLEKWRDESGLWSEKGERARGAALGWGVALAVVGGLGCFGAAWLTQRLGGGAIPLVAMAGVLTGAGVALAVRSWELRVRRAEGTALWLRVESFRRFLHESEAQHADWAAEHGILREYTAWAVAVGEIDRWEKAVAASSLARSTDTTGVHLALAAGSLSRATSSAATKPSSSGGGGFSGGVGGGAGGGGGGSW